MKEFLYSSIEFRGWGWNLTTFTALLTVVCTILQAIGLWNQSRSIWKNQSAASVSKPPYIYGFFYFLSFFVYSAHKQSLALLLNSFIALMYLPILAGIARYGKISRVDVGCALLSMLAVPTMLLTAQKELFLSILLTFVFLTLAMQPIEIWRSKSAGVVSPIMLMIGIGTNIIWSSYAFATGNKVFRVFNPTLLLLFSVSLMLYYRYRKPPSDAVMQKTHG